MEVAILVPLIVFASIVLMIATPFYFKHRNQRIIYEAIKTTVEKTGSADPALIDAIAQDSVGPHRDLRRGILLLCLAIAIGGLRLFTDADFPFIGAALFPGLIGAAFIGFHFFLPREITV